MKTVCTDISEEEHDAVLYDLQSIVVHAGEYGSGHYYAYVRPDVRSDRWYRFNDHIAEAVTFDDVVADSYGGATPKRSKQKKKKFWQRLFGGNGGASFGYGGRTSNAYVLQYVKRIEVSNLYGEG